MSKEVIAAINHSHDLASYATPELRGLFHDWLSEIEEMVAVYIQKYRRVDPSELAKHFKLQIKSVIFILGKLTEEGKIDMHVENHQPKIRLLRSNDGEVD